MSITLHGVAAVLFLAYIGAVFVFVWTVLVLVCAERAKQWWCKRHPASLNFDAFDEEAKQYWREL